MAGKGKKTGPRVAVSWGSTKVKVKGRTETISLISMMSESVFKRTGLQAYKGATTLKITKDKKGRQRIAAQGITRSASKYVLVWFGDVSTKTKQKKWHRVPVPARVSLATAAKRLQAGKGSAVEVRFPSTPASRKAVLKSPTRR
jgi:hypothetical protein